VHVRRPGTCEEFNCRFMTEIMLNSDTLKAVFKDCDINISHIVKLLPSKQLLCCFF
jgi:hypothetical protein